MSAVIRCPHCQRNITKIVNRASASRAGSAGRGASKARNPEAMRAAARKRWAAVKWAAIWECGCIMVGSSPIPSLCPQHGKPRTQPHQS